VSAPREIEGRWLLEWSEALDPAGHAARIERVEALLAFDRTEEALAAVDAALADTVRTEKGPRRIRVEKEWLGQREQCHRRLGRVEEADWVRDEILKAPPRDPALSPKLIDLSAHYTASIYDGRGWHTTENLRMLPETFRPRGGIEFDIRGMIQLQSGRYPRGTIAISGKDMNELYEKSFPVAAKGIRVGFPVKSLHFLTAVSWGNGPAGTELARIVIHYEDGGKAEVPLRFKEDIVDWTFGSDQKIGIDRIAWAGNRPPRRLMRKTWTNPSPEKTIREIDFVSGRRTGAPFLLAVTAG